MFELFSTTIFPWLLQKLDSKHPHHFSRKLISKKLEEVGFSIEINKLNPLGLRNGGFLFRIGANGIARDLWVLASK